MGGRTALSISKTPSPAPNHQIPSQVHDVRAPRWTVLYSVHTDLDSSAASRTHAMPGPRCVGPGEQLKPRDMARPPKKNWVSWTTTNRNCPKPAVAGNQWLVGGLGGVLARQAPFFYHSPPVPVFAPTSPNNLEYLLAASKNLAHPLHPVCDDGKGGGWK